MFFGKFRIRYFILTYFVTIVRNKVVCMVDDLAISVISSTRPGKSDLYKKEFRFQCLECENLRTRFLNIYDFIIIFVRVAVQGLYWNNQIQLLPFTSVFHSLMCTHSILSIQFAKVIRFYSGARNFIQTHGEGIYVMT